VEWERERGNLQPHQRLIPLQFIALGGELTLDNLIVREAAEAMRIRGPIAQQLHDLPNDAEITLKIED
jgi:hypothetical protein